MTHIALNENVEPDQGIYPWRDVDACRDNIVPAETLAELRSGPTRCPHCSRPARDLTWFEFISPDWTWEMLCGRQGWMAVCDGCRVQVEFQLTILA